MPPTASPGHSRASDPPQMEDDPRQTRIAGIEHRRDPSVYLGVSRGYWCHGSGYYPVHKVDGVASSSSSSGDDPSSPRSPAAGARATRVANLKTDVGNKTFVTVQSRWIVGVGGDPGGTVIFDAKTAEAIAGPTLAAAKLSPVVAAVGHRVYALSWSPEFIGGPPDSAPWFEVLDLSTAMDAAAGGGGDLTLSRLPELCSWEALPPPPFFPTELSAADHLIPPIFVVTAYAVVEHYILLTLNEPADAYGAIFNREEFHKVTYAFDTRSGEWLKVDDDKCLPFAGAAIPHGSTGRVFLGLSANNNDAAAISAYRISVSASSFNKSSTMVGVAASGKFDGSLKLSVTEFLVKIKADDEQVCTGRGWGENYLFTSVDRARFCTLFYKLEKNKRCMRYCKVTGQYFSTKLCAKLRTYEIDSESLALLETLEKEKLLGVKKPEIVVSSQWEQEFKIFSAHGFYYYQPIAFILSI